MCRCVCKVSTGNSGTCKRLEEQVASLLKEKDEAHCRHQETQMKLKGLTEYFEQKELTLHT